jgi:hypothetical protein
MGAGGWRDGWREGWRARLGVSLAGACALAIAAPPAGAEFVKDRVVSTLPNAVTSLAFSADGQWLYAVASDPLAADATVVRLPAPGGAPVGASYRQRGLGGIGAGPDGTVLVTWSPDARISLPTVITLPADLSSATRWPAYAAGTSRGAALAGALAVTEDGTVVTTDANNGRLYRFTVDGSQLGGFGSLGRGPGQFRPGGPRAVAADGAGGIFVADAARIERFDTAGSFRAAWAAPTGPLAARAGVVAVVSDATLRVYDANGRFQAGAVGADAESIAIAPDGRVLVGKPDGRIIAYRRRPDPPGCPIAVTGGGGVALGARAAPKELLGGFVVRPTVRPCAVTVAATILLPGGRRVAASRVTATTDLGQAVGKAPRLAAAARRRVLAALAARGGGRATLRLTFTSRAGAGAATVVRRSVRLLRLVGHRAAPMTPARR